METFKRNINLVVACLDVVLPLMAAVMDKTVQIISFDDECTCISQLLSIKDKLIYVVVPMTLGDFVVPLIHNHICIEHIYIYEDCIDEGSTGWMEDYTKIHGNESSINLLTDKISEDIDSVMKRPSHWSRSKALLAELCSQTPQSDILSSINEAVEDDLNTWCIVVLYLDSPRPFDLSHPKIRVDEFNNTEECIRSIKAEEISVFLIISMNQLDDIRSVAELDAVHALYIVSTLTSKEQIEMLSTYPKLSGVFVLNEDLLEQLIADICFYRHIRVHTPTISVFKIESNILDKLTETQKDFLCFQLFSDILSQLPTQLTTTDNNDWINGNGLLSRLIETNSQIIYLFNQFDFPTLLKSTSELKNMNQKIVSMTKNVTSSFVTVYWAQLVSQKDVEILKDNENALLAVQIFVLASRSFQSVAEIARRAVNNQLNVILFELKLSPEVFVTHENSDTVVFNLGTPYRLVSVNPAPDGVWRVQLDIAHTSMQRIKDQLRIEIGSYLTWLTFGNYLAAFKLFSAAQHYNEYLQQVLPLEHPSLASIYNNMGLIYSEKKDNRTALELYKKALKAKSLESSVVDKQENSSISHLSLSLSPSTSMDRISILAKIAEIACYQGDEQTALKYYRQALEIATDATSRHFCQAKIEKLLSSDANSET